MSFHFCHTFCVFFMLEHTKFVHLQALCEVKLSVLAQTQLNVKNEDWETWYNFIEILDFVVKAYR